MSPAKVPLPLDLATPCTTICGPGRADLDGGQGRNLRGAGGARRMSTGVREQPRRGYAVRVTSGRHAASLVSQTDRLRWSPVSISATR